MIRLLFTGVILLTLSFVHADKIFSSKTAKTPSAC
jgi:hypothetical protein